MLTFLKMKRLKLSSVEMGQQLVPKVTKQNIILTIMHPSSHLSLLQKLSLILLHIFLRIMDQLVYQLTYYLRPQDNCVYLNQNVNVEACDNLMRFQNFIKKIGITDWKFVIKLSWGPSMGHMGRP